MGRARLPHTQDGRHWRADSLTCMICQPNVGVCHCTAVYLCPSRCSDSSPRLVERGSSSLLVTRRQPASQRNAPQNAATRCTRTMQRCDESSFSRADSPCSALCSSLTVLIACAVFRSIADSSPLLDPSSALTTHSDHGLTAIGQQWQHSTRRSGEGEKQRSAALLHASGTEATSHSR